MPEMDKQIALMDAIAVELNQPGVGPKAALTIITAIANVVPKVLEIAGADEAAADVVNEAIGFLASRAARAYKAEQDEKSAKAAAGPTTTDLAKAVSAKASTPAKDVAKEPAAAAG